MNLTSFAGLDASKYPQKHATKAQQPKPVVKRVISWTTHIEASFKAKPASAAVRRDTPADPLALTVGLFDNHRK